MLKSLIVVVAFAAFLPRALKWYFSVGISQPLSDYDFIIVGGGTTGCVVANRLSEDPKFRVLLIEAGGENPVSPYVYVPRFAGALMKTEYDWRYVSEPQTGIGEGMVDKKILFPRGKILGGTSILNTMIYARGSPHDYDEWVKLGASGWSYKDVFPYFKKSEMASAKALQNSEYHGTDGYLSVEMPNDFEISEMFLNATEEKGYKTIDYNSRDDEGFGLIQYTMKNGMRHGSADAFIYPFASERKNLHVLTNAQVTRLLFEKKQSLPRAIGVEYVKDGQTHKITAAKEVIVSAGAIGTPHLLLLSGIGSKEQLEKHKVEVVADLPGVGENLQDHPYISYGFNSDLDVNDDVLTSNNLFTISNIFSYLYDGSGHFGSGFVSAYGYLKLDKNKADKRLNRPDVHLMFHPMQLNTEGELLSILHHLMNFRTDVVQGMVEKARKFKRNHLHDFHIAITLARPHSRGYIRLLSNNYTQHPAINPMYLSDKRDVKVFLKAFRFLDTLEETDAFKSRGYKSVLDAFDCPGEDDRTDEFYECFLRKFTQSEYHPCCTAKIGRKNDPMAVVDERLRLHKVEGLRIADASVMPQIPSSPLQATCYMIGEKISDMIKQDWTSV